VVAAYEPEVFKHHRQRLQALCLPAGVAVFAPHRPDRQDSGEPSDHSRASSLVK
jgi:hypothetical protein